MNYFDLIVYLIIFLKDRHFSFRIADKISEGNIGVYLKSEHPFVGNGCMYRKSVRGIGHKERSKSALERGQLKFIYYILYWWKNEESNITSLLCITVREEIYFVPDKSWVKLILVLI